MQPRRLLCPKFMVNVGTEPYIILFIFPSISQSTRSGMLASSEWRLLIGALSRSLYEDQLECWIFMESRMHARWVAVMEATDYWRGWPFLLPLPLSLSYPFHFFLFLSFPSIRSSIHLSLPLSFLLHFIFLFLSMNFLFSIILCSSFIVPLLFSLFFFFVSLIFLYFVFLSFSFSLIFRSFLFFFTSTLLSVAPKFSFFSHLFSFLSFSSVFCAHFFPSLL